MFVANKQLLCTPSLMAIDNTRGDSHNTRGSHGWAPLNDRHTPSTHPLALPSLSSPDNNTHTHTYTLRASPGQRSYLACGVLCSWPWTALEASHTCTTISPCPSSTGVCVT